MLNVKVTFLKNIMQKTLQVRTAVFKVKVKEIKKRELPELDDDFASEDK
mgnify:CR=1 FL=1